MSFFINPLRHFTRYFQISKVLLKYGLGEYIKTFHPAFLLAQFGLGRKKILLRPIPERLRIVLEELGPTFIKIGQFASTRGDILPEEFTTELAKLQDNVKPEPFFEIKRIVEKEIGPINEVFDEFNEEPIGSASIAQVYEAKLNGQSVIVKVRRPKIEKIIETDIDILNSLVNIAEANVPGLKGKRLKRLVETFARMIRQELDFTNEANNAEKFREIFQGDKRVYIPKIYKEISTNKVLIQEHIRGIKISDIKRMEKNGIDPVVVARNGAEIFLKQILVAGIFHADPHPGNIFVLKDNVIVPIDFGMVGRLTPKIKQEILDIIIGVVEREPERVARALLRVGIVENSVDFESLKEDIFYVVNKFEGRSLAQISVADFTNDINRVIRNYNIRIPQELLYLGKAISQIESIGRELDPEFDTITWLERFMIKNNLRALSIREFLKRGRWWLKDMLAVLFELPENLNRFFELNHRGPTFIKTEEKRDTRIYWLSGGFGIMILSIFIFLVSNLPLFKVLSILGLLFSFMIFISQIFLAIFSK
uniref:AarF/ABC1/UbiB kinase family protein n=1 Tax=candidate division WOR-3 bacterium TaxID=2052148 RepID=A0A7C4X8N7_UNCW3